MSEIWVDEKLADALIANREKLSSLKIKVRPKGTEDRFKLWSEELTKAVGKEATLATFLKKLETKDGKCLLQFIGFTPVVHFMTLDWIECPELDKMLGVIREQPGEIWVDRQQCTKLFDRWSAFKGTKAKIKLPSTEHSKSGNAVKFEGGSYIAVQMFVGQEVEIINAVLERSKDDRELIRYTVKASNGSVFYAYHDWLDCPELDRAFRKGPIYVSTALKDKLWSFGEDGYKKLDKLQLKAKIRQPSTELSKTGHHQKWNDSLLGKEVRVQGSGVVGDGRDANGNHLLLFPVIDEDGKTHHVYHDWLDCPELDEYFELNGAPKKQDAPTTQQVAPPTTKGTYLTKKQLQQLKEDFNTKLKHQSFTIKQGSKLEGFWWDWVDTLNPFIGTTRTITSFKVVKELEDGTAEVVFVDNTGFKFYKEWMDCKVLENILAPRPKRLSKEQHDRLVAADKDGRLKGLKLRLKDGENFPGYSATFIDSMKRWIGKNYTARALCGDSVPDAPKISAVGPNGEWHNLYLDWFDCPQLNLIIDPPRKFTEEEKAKIVKNAGKLIGKTATCKKLVKYPAGFCSYSVEKEKALLGKTLKVSSVNTSNQCDDICITIKDEEGYIYNVYTSWLDFPELDNLLATPRQFTKDEAQRIVNWIKTEGIGTTVKVKQGETFSATAYTWSSKMDELVGKELKVESAVLDPEGQPCVFCRDDFGNGWYLYENWFESKDIIDGILTLTSLPTQEQPMSAPEQEKPPVEQNADETQEIAGFTKEEADYILANKHKLIGADLTIHEGRPTKDVSISWNKSQDKILIGRTFQFTDVTVDRIIDNRHVLVFTAQDESCAAKLYPEWFESSALDKLLAQRETNSTAKLAGASFATILTVSLLSKLLKRRTKKTATKAEEKVEEQVSVVDRI